MNSLCTNSNQAIVLGNSRYRAHNTAQSIPVKKSHWINMTGAAMLLSKFKNYIARKCKQHTDRQAFNYLLTLDDNILKDIGVTKADVLWASKLPITEDAAEKIEVIARRR